MSLYSDYTSGPVSPGTPFFTPFFGVFPSGFDGARIEAVAGKHEFKSNPKGEIISFPQENRAVYRGRFLPITVKFISLDETIETTVVLRKSGHAIHIPGNVRVEISSDEDFTFLHEIPESIENENPEDFHRAPLFHAKRNVSELGVGEANVDVYEMPYTPEVAEVIGGVSPPVLERTLEIKSKS